MMRNYINIVNEGLSSGEYSPIEWSTKSETKWSGSFQVGETDYQIDFILLKSGWALLFGNRTKLTDTNQSFASRVIRTVIKAAAELIEKVHPSSMVITARGSRKKLYMAIIEHYWNSLERLGYNPSIQEQNDGTAYIMLRKHPITEGAHTPAEYDGDDAAHYDALEKTGFFGAQGAGCVPMCRKTGRVMVVHRSDSVEQPRTWGNLGGAFHNSEAPMQAAKRELYEETGYSGPAEMIPMFVFTSGSFRYSNFLALVEEEFVPDLGWEATDYKWVELGNWPQPLHFGLQALFSDPHSVEIMKHYEELSKHA